MKSRAVVTVLGEDKIGIVAAVSKVLAENQVNIEDISQKIMSDLFAMIMLVTVDEEVTSLEKLQKELDKVGQQISLRITIQHEDIFRYINRI